MPGLIRERDLAIPALRCALAAPRGIISTSRLIEDLEEEFQPEGHDAEIMDGRQDTYFSQKVRNLISHRSTATSMFAKGYVIYLEDIESIQITEPGREFLNQVPEE
jgi:hypothetical protein